MMRAVVALLEEFNEHDLHVLARDAKEFDESSYNISLQDYSPIDLLPIDFTQTLDRMMIAIKYDIEIHKLKSEDESRKIILADELAEFRHKQFEIFLKNKSHADIEIILNKLANFVTVLQMLVENFPEDQKIKHQCKHLIDLQMQIYPFYLQRIKIYKKEEIEAYEKKVCAEIPALIKQTLDLLKQELTCNSKQKNISLKIKSLIAISARFLFLNDESVNDLVNDTDTELEQACRSLTQERKIQGDILLKKCRAITPPPLEIKQCIVDANEPRIFAASVLDVECKKIIINIHLQYLWNEIHKLKGADKGKIGKKPVLADLVVYANNDNINNSRLVVKFHIFNELKESLENRKLFAPEKLSLFYDHLKQNRDVLIAREDEGVEKSVRSFSDFFVKRIKKHKVLSRSKEVVLALEQTRPSFLPSYTGGKGGVAAQF